MASFIYVVEKGEGCGKNEYTESGEE